MENYMFLVTVADGKTAASWGEGKKTAKLALSPLLDVP